MLWKRDHWETTKDLAKLDDEGYLYHCGRADDVIISAGWTMSAVEIEATLLKHPDVQEAAVRSEEHTSELQSLMRNSYAVFCLKKKRQGQTRAGSTICRHK